MEQKAEVTLNEIISDDNELVEQDVQLISQNQENGQAAGHFLKTNVDTGEGNVLSTTGKQQEPETVWRAHFTLNELREVVVILENNEFSRQAGQTCVLAATKDDNTGHYNLSIKQIQMVPTRLNQMDPEITFYKKPKSPASEFIYFESTMKIGQRLLVGFDSNGQPMPMDQVQEFTYGAEPYFRIIGHMI